MVLLNACTKKYVHLIYADERIKKTRGVLQYTSICCCNMYYVTHK